MLGIRIVGLTRGFISCSLRTSYTRQHFPATDSLSFLDREIERERERERERDAVSFLLWFGFGPLFMCF